MPFFKNNAFFSTEIILLVLIKRRTIYFCIAKFYFKGRKEQMPVSYKKRTSNIGKVYKARTQYIDKDTKRTRRYVIRDEVNGKVKVSKLKSIKQFDESGKNIDPHLTEINHTRYGLEKRTGVDNQVFSQNRITKKPLMLSDKKVFFKQEEEFTLGSHDWSRIQNSKNKKKR